MQISFFQTSDDAKATFLFLLPTDCAIPQYYGDGYCDDVNNVEECNWDNGDCCTAKLTDPEEWDDYCTQCLCLDPNEQTTIAPTSTAATSTATSGWGGYFLKIFNYPF